MGAILSTKLKLTAIPRGSGKSEADYHNFRFTDKGEECLSQWMEAHLEYASYQCSDSLEQLETLLINENNPPLNLTNCNSPEKQEILDLRKDCRTQAKNHC